MKGKIDPENLWSPKRAWHLFDPNRHLVVAVPVASMPPTPWFVAQSPCQASKKRPAKSLWFFWGSRPRSHLFSITKLLFFAANIYTNRLIVPGPPTTVIKTFKHTFGGGSWYRSSFKRFFFRPKVLAFDQPGASAFCQERPGRVSVPWKVF